MEKLLKIAVMIGLLLAGGGVFYHYVVFLPAVEQQKAAKAEEEKAEAARQEEARQQQYETCTASARENYESNWAAACKHVAATRADELRSCLADKLVMTNPYMGASYCKSEYGKSDASADCSLPKGRAESINKT